MAALSIILTWEIPWTEEPGGLQSVAQALFMHCLISTINQWGSSVLPPYLYRQQN